MKTTLIYLFIILGGITITFSGPANSQLKETLGNPWLAAFVSAAMVLPVFFIMFVMFPRPLPTTEGILNMPWWAPLGSVASALAILAGQLFVSKVGAAALTGLVVTANLLTSLVIDHFGWVNMEQHSLSPGRVAGAGLMVAGITLISKF